MKKIALIILTLCILMMAIAPAYADSMVAGTICTTYRMTSNRNPFYVYTNEGHSDLYVKLHVIGNATVQFYDYDGNVVYTESSAVINGSRSFYVGSNVDYIRVTPTWPFTCSVAGE